ncbi:MAG: NUDIX domain-containing protein [Actinomycetia bacterium]|nr:NUDIX domain-containing protein [Actinomycetes bacterium]MCP4225079.1 NUDIX domain-containing protein [Actinomycetes bacterium]MCP5031717.1 NUDIX domain-containing protein [Actinomycetes bacterium]
MTEAVDAASELVEVVDVDGAVVEIVTRQRLRAENLRHRCTYVAVVTADEQIVVHQRADWKDVFPSYWDVCFGGVCGVGEPWLVAAERELAEEAGVTGQELIELGPVAYDGEEGHVIGRTYLVRYDGPLSCPDGEVVAVDTVPITMIEDWMAVRPLCPDSQLLALPLVRAYFEQG